MTFVMASSFAPVPFTLILYNKVVKKYGIAIAYRYSLIIFSLGMIIMFLCCMFHAQMQPLHLNLIAILGGIFVSFSLGSFFSITYTVPTTLANREFAKTGNGVSGMYFAVQGLFEGIAAGIATGLILVTLKKHDVIQLLPIIACVACGITFVLTMFFPKELSTIGKVKADCSVQSPSESQTDSIN